jgi:hypothetical protein
MEEFAWERYCRDNENVSLNDMFKFKYEAIIADLIPDQLRLVDRVRSYNFVGNAMKVPIIKE